MKIGNRPKLLFFTAEAAPTKAEEKTAQTYMGKFNPVFRVAGHAETGPIETAAAVAGEVPDRYADAYPHADDYDEDEAKAAAEGSRPPAPNPEGAPSHGVFAPRGRAKVKART